MTKKTAKTTSPRTAKPSTPKTKQIASDDLSRKTLEEAIRVAKVIKHDYAGKLAIWDDIAASMGFSATNANNEYYLWEATAYGIVLP